MNIKIHWSDRSFIEKKGTAETESLLISPYVPINAELQVKRLNSKQWQSLGLNTEVELLEGHQKFRLKYNDGDIECCSNELTYTKVVYDCHAYMIRGEKDPLNVFSVEYLDTQGVGQVAIVLPNENQKFFFAIKDSVIAKRGKGQIFDNGKC